MDVQVFGTHKTRGRPEGASRFFSERRVKGALRRLEGARSQQGASCSALPRSSGSVRLSTRTRRDTPNSGLASCDTTTTDGSINSSRNHSCFASLSFDASTKLASAWPKTTGSPGLRRRRDDGDVGWFRRPGPGSPLALDLGVFNKQPRARRPFGRRSALPPMELSHWRSSLPRCSTGRMRAIGAASG